MGRRAFQALTANLLEQPLFQPQPVPHVFFFGESQTEPSGRIWQFKVNQLAVSSIWQPIGANYLPTRTFQSVAGMVSKIPRCNAPISTPLYRIMLCHSGGLDDKRNHFGIWSPERCFLMQYTWSDDIPLLDTSTSQLRALQAQHRFRPHTVHVCALRKGADMLDPTGSVEEYLAQLSRGE